MGIRSFLAFELPEEIKNTVSFIYNGLKSYSLDIKWVKEENIHLTVVFMGNINEKNLISIEEVVKESCDKYAPFTIRAKGIGIFSSIRKPRVLWIGIEGDIERMGNFRNRLQKKLKSFGIKEETRKFSPHLTLGRFKKGFNKTDKLIKLMPKFQEIVSSSVILKELTLFKSDLKPEGAIYTKLNSWPLQGKK